MRHAFALVVALSLAVPASAQPADAPVNPCPSGSVVLTPEAAVDAAKRLATAEAKAQVYDANPPLPVWAVVLLVAGGVALGAAGALVAVEVSKSKP